MSNTQHEQDRARDAQVAQKIFGLTVQYISESWFSVRPAATAPGSPYMLPGGMAGYPIDRYSTDHNDAIKVVEHLRAKGYLFCFETNLEGGYEVWLTPPGAKRGRETVNLRGYSLPDAIVNAALRMVEMRDNVTNAKL